MINRILIRIKVVQMLYSYLLTRSEFKIEAAPETTSKDKRYAYSFYLDLLLLVLELSGVKVQGGHKSLPVPEAGLNKYLTGNRMVKSLSTDDQIRTLILRGTSSIADFDTVAAKLYNEIITSAAYRSFIRLKDRDLKTDVNFWLTMLNTVIRKNTEVLEVARKSPDFTSNGFEKAFDMVAATLSDYTDTRTLLTEARNSLDRSLDKAYELYHGLLMLPVAITREQERRLDANRNKYVPSAEDLNPNTRLIDNEFVKAIEANQDMQDYLANNPINLLDDDVLIKRLLDNILASDLYREYLEAPATDWASDCEFWRAAMKNIILPSDDLAEALESQSVYWNDDVVIMGTFAIKTIKKFAGSNEGKGVHLLPEYKDEEDSQFGPRLFLYAVENHEAYRALIDRFVNSAQWDSERVAFMDVVILICALAEILNFPSIPVNVSLNEYIEIAHYYSTAKSGQFINGILYSVLKDLHEKGELGKPFEVR